MQDRIEREILIEAPVQRVWRLVSEPGWFIGDGDRSAQTTRTEGDLVILEDPKYGQFQVLRVSAEAPHRVSYRCSEYPGERPADGTTTLVEFTLAERGDGTLLRVVESGFASLAASHDGWGASIEGNTKGWEQQLDIAKREAERVRA